MLEQPHASEYSSIWMGHWEACDGSDLVLVETYRKRYEGAWDVCIRLSFLGLVCWLEIR
jgi:hypothetical protein